MSVQENKLKAIADAIREKEGSSALIPAMEFPERIRGLSGSNVEILESYNSEKVYYIGYLQLVNFTDLVTPNLNYQVLEGYE